MSNDEILQQIMEKIQKGELSVQWDGFVPLGGRGGGMQQFSIYDEDATVGRVDIGDDTTVWWNKILSKALGVADQAVCSYDVKDDITDKFVKDTIYDAFDRDDKEFSAYFRKKTGCLNFPYGNESINRDDILAEIETGYTNPALKTSLLQNWILCDHNHPDDEKLRRYEKAHSIEEVLDVVKDFTKDCREFVLVLTDNLFYTEEIDQASASRFTPEEIQSVKDWFQRAKEIRDGVHEYSINCEQVSAKIIVDENQKKSQIIVNSSSLSSEQVYRLNREMEIADYIYIIDGFWPEYVRMNGTDDVELDFDKKRQIAEHMITYRETAYPKNESRELQDCFRKALNEISSMSLDDENDKEM